MTWRRPLWAQQLQLLTTKKEIQITIDCLVIPFFLPWASCIIEFLHELARLFNSSSHYIRGLFHFAIGSSFPKRGFPPEIFSHATSAAARERYRKCNCNKGPISPRSRNWSNWKWKTNGPRPPNLYSFDLHRSFTTLPSARVIENFNSSKVCVLLKIPQLWQKELSNFFSFLSNFLLSFLLSLSSYLFHSVCHSLCHVCFCLVSCLIDELKDAG